MLDRVSRSFSSFLLLRFSRPSMLLTDRPSSLAISTF